MLSLVANCEMPDATILYRKNRLFESKNIQSTVHFIISANIIFLKT